MYIFFIFLIEKNKRKLKNIFKSLTLFFFRDLDDKIIAQMSKKLGLKNGALDKSFKEDGLACELKKSINIFIFTHF